MKKRHLFLLFILAVTVFPVAAQISRGGHPFPYHGMKDRVPPIVLPVLNRAIALEQTFKDEDLVRGKKPMRFAEIVSVSLSPGNSGRWTRINDKEMIWRVSLTSENSYGLSVYFSRFRLKEGAMLFIYNASQEQVLGGFNNLNNKVSGNLQTDFVAGDEMIIELQAKDSCSFGELEIGSISRAFVDIFRHKDGRHGLAGECNIGINCPEGEDWQVIKRSVCRIYIGSRGEFCTGTLINNVNSDGKPYLLTANHCIKYPADANTSVFVFDYESPDCSNEDGSVSLSLSSGTVLATSDSLDFTLLELSEMPPENYKPYYAGWSIVRSPSTRSAAIHHPWGDVKMISFDNDPLLITYQTLNAPAWLTDGSAPQAFWRVARWDAGTTEPGSSGAPLFNMGKEIVGNLTGGDATCALPVNDYFSKFFMCWSYYPEDRRSLHSWLDPGNTGVAEISGLDPYHPEEPEVFLERFLVYPNPNDGHFSVETDSLNLEGAKISLYNIVGQCLATYYPSSSEKANFDFSDLASGIYILEIRLGDLLSLKKIIITK